MNVIVKGQPSVDVKIEAKVVDTYKTPDTALSETSTNPVQNKVVTAELNKRATKTDLSSLGAAVEENKKASETALSELSAKVDEDVEVLQTELESHDVLIEDLQNTKIDKENDDYYPNMAVGIADNLAGDDLVSSEFNLRMSGGGAIEDGTARIESIKGNSVAWNQRVDFSKDSSWFTKDIELTSQDGSRKGIVVQDGVASCYFYYRCDDFVNSLIIGHKYFYKTTVKAVMTTQSAGRASVSLGGVAGLNNISVPIGDSWQYISALFVMNSISATPYATFLISSGGTGDTIEAKELQLIDLTLMFGAGNEPTTIGEFYARIPQNVDLNAYNEGEVIHCNVDAVKSVGRNQWDEEWESGNLNEQGIPVPDIHRIRTKNYIRVSPNTMYYLRRSTSEAGQIYLYDYNKALISLLIASQFTTPSDCYYIKFSIGNSVNSVQEYNHDICINRSDTGFNGQYEPYISREQSLAIVNKAFPQGIRSAGTAHDEIRYNKTTHKWEKVTRIGEVKMKELSWVKVGSNKTEYMVDFPTNATSNGSMLSARYVFDGKKYSGSIADKTFVINQYTLNQIILNDSNYTDVNSFVASLTDNDILIYELAEPIIEELDFDGNLDYEVWNGGTEEAIADTPSTPMKADIAYGFNAVDKIRENAAQLQAVMQSTITDAELDNLFNE